VRRLTIAALLCGAILLAWAAVSSGASTTLPAGPRLAVVLRGSDEATTTEVVTMGPDGEDVRGLARGTLFDPISHFEHPNWSPDGKLMAFSGEGEETPTVSLLGADGSNLHPLRSSEHPGGPDDTTLPEPLFDPKTGELVVAVVHTPNGEGLFGDSRETGRIGQYRGEFWALPVRGGGKPRRLSKRLLASAGVFFPFSIASNGEVAATDLNRKGFNVAVLDPRGGPLRVVARTRTQKEGSLEPAISPDGKEIVYKVDRQKEVDDRRTLIGTELMIVSTEGGEPKRLVWVRGGTAWPTWDPSGSRIAFTALADAGGEDSPYPQDGDALMEINPDGTCLTKVYSLGTRGAVEGAAWQPGAERGAGPISC
jgi:dipeptidyl aminopeptidase/acylaminoacyl peptidase